MKQMLKNLVSRHGRLAATIAAVVAAFVLSIQFSDRGVQFEVSNSTFSAAEAGEKEKYDLSAQKIFNRVLLQLKDKYVEPKRVKPVEMFVGALDHLQHSIPEVVIDFVGGKESPEKLRVNVVGSEKTFEVKSMESLWGMSFQVKSVFQFIEDHLSPDAEVDYQDIEYAAINGMLNSLDPHSSLLPPEPYKEMKTQTGGEFGGLGIVISVRDGKLTVISPIDGTPASRTGIKAKDRIVRIEDESTINMNLNEAVSMLRGEPGSKVDIWVQRKEWPEPKKFTIERAIININSIMSEPLKNEVGYLRIKNFQSNTHEDLKKHLDKLKKSMGGMKGLVLDLRDNPGGLLEQAIKVSDTFLEKGTIVSTVGADGKIREKETASKSNTEPKYPIVVLVNAGSASASEIISGALQNHGRALVVGDKTFGKGTVQVLYEFPDGSALKLTVAQYLTPGGISIQNRGISPDLHLMPVQIPEEPSADRNVDMFASKSTIRESDLNSHLSNKGAERVEKGGIGFIRYLDDSKPENERYDDPNEFERDFQIDFAQGLLSELKQKHWKRSSMLNQLQPRFKKASGQQMDKIAKRLEKYNVDWSKGKSTEKPDYDFDIVTPESDKAIEAGEKFEIKAKLTNEGKKPLYRSHAISDSDNPILKDHEFLFGKLAPGESKTWTSYLSIPTRMPSRQDLIRFELNETNKAFGEDPRYPVEINGKKRPQFAFSYTVNDENNDGILQKGEEVKLDVYVKNIGEAPSEDTLVYLKNKAGSSVFLEKGRIEVPKIGVGEHKNVTFAFRIKEPPQKEAENIDLNIDIYDPKFQEYIQRGLTVPYSKKPKDFREASGYARVKAEDTSLYIGPSKEGDAAAVAKLDATLPVVARVDKWLQVSLGKRKVWVPTEEVDYKKDKSLNGREYSSVENRIFFQAPSIDIQPTDKMTDKERATVSVDIEDDHDIKDYYVFVYSRDEVTDQQSRKLRYRRVDSPKASFEMDVPLFEGMNRITVIARDYEGMETSNDSYIYRQTENDLTNLLTGKKENVAVKDSKKSAKNKEKTSNN